MVHRRGRLNLPDNIRKGVSVDAFGRIQSAPTVNELKINKNEIL